MQWVFSNIPAVPVCNGKTVKSLETSQYFYLFSFFQNNHKLLFFSVKENSQNAPLVHATLETLLRFLNWIPLGYIFETKLISTLVYKVNQPTWMRKFNFPLGQVMCLSVTFSFFTPSVPECSHVSQRDAEMSDRDCWSECQSVRGAVCQPVHPHHEPAQTG